VILEKKIMKQLNKLPIFYQNLNIKNEQTESIPDENSKKPPDKRYNYTQIDFYQTNYHKPSVYYKVISKICMYK